MVSKESELFREKVKSLNDKLTFIEPFILMYSGGSPAFLEYSRITRGTYAIPMTERTGSIAGLAKRELQMQFVEENIPSYQRYSLGRRLGFTPSQIYIIHKDIGKYMKFVMPEKFERSFEEDCRSKKETLKYEKVCEDFERLFSEEKAKFFFVIKLELNSRKNTYDVRVFSQLYKELLFTDPFTQGDLGKLFENLISLAGPRSKKLMLECAS